MATESLLYLTHIGIVLLIGLICTIISNKLKIPNYLLLIIVGIGLSNLSFAGKSLITFSPLFLSAISVLALVMIVFDASSRLKLKVIDTLSTSAFGLGILFFILNSAALTVVAYRIIGVPTLLLSLLFATIVSGTSPSVILALFKGQKSKVFELLEIESIVNTPLVVLFPFLIIDLISKGAEFYLVQSQFIPFLQQFVTAIGTGILVGIILFKFMKYNSYSEVLSPLAILITALLTYVVSEYLGGNGVLAVTTAGIFFGNTFIEGKKKLQEFSSTISFLLVTLVFMLIGIVVPIDFSARVFIQAGYLFAISVLVRFLSVMIILNDKTNFTFKEKLFMTLNIPKGIAVAVVALTLAISEINGLVPVLNLVLVFMIYSMVLSTLVTHFSKYFTQIDVLEKVSPTITKAKVSSSKKRKKRKSKNKSRTITKKRKSSRKNKTSRKKKK